MALRCECPPHTKKGTNLSKPSTQAITVAQSNDSMLGYTFLHWFTMETYSLSSSATPSESPSGSPSSLHKRLFSLSIGALGVVYGDIGTSPLYALKECFLLKATQSSHETLTRVPVDVNNILGVLSLVFWSLTFVVGIKYISLIMRADNQGEGGILALLALSKPKKESIAASEKSTIHAGLISLALVGAALLYGDGVITPAISVLGAVDGLQYAEGLENIVINHPYIVVFITVFILFILFMVQKRGTDQVAALFGPVMVVWFVTIAFIGLKWILRYPSVLVAIHPKYAVQFFLQNGWTGFRVLGGVVLCITGGEALYADMGHFGKRPIRIAWYSLVFPALLLNYFGQGALLLSQPLAAIKHPFFNMVSGVWQYPLVLIATLAAVIASQALISGVYSLTQQAVQLGYLPRIPIVHTSGHHQGQIFVPHVNFFLMVACIALVLVFKTADNLAAAYGIAVTGTMGITSILFYSIARSKWKWPLWKAGSLLLLMGIVDAAFFGANVLKLPHNSGGWVPVLIGAALFIVMTTWKKGRQLLKKYDTEATLPLEMLLQDLEHHPLPRVSGMAVFMTPPHQEVPLVLLHHIKHNKVLHEEVMLLSISTARVPEVPPEQRVHIEEERLGFYRIKAYYGFMQTPHMAEILKLCYKAGLKTVLNETSFYLGREALRLTGHFSLWSWRKILFVLLHRNAQTAMDFFGIPPNRVIEMGTQVEV